MSDIAEAVGKRIYAIRTSKHEIFGKGKLDEVCKKYDIDTLAKLPIDPTIAEKIDSGLVEDISMPDLDPIIEKIEKL